MYLFWPATFHLPNDQIRNPSNFTPFSSNSANTLAVWHSGDGRQVRLQKCNLFQWQTFRLCTKRFIQTLFTVCQIVWMVVPDLFRLNKCGTIDLLSQRYSNILCQWVGCFYHKTLDVMVFYWIFIVVWCTARALRVPVWARGGIKFPDKIVIDRLTN